MVNFFENMFLIHFNYYLYCNSVISHVVVSRKINKALLAILNRPWVYCSVPAQIIDTFTKITVKRIIIHRIIRYDVVGIRKSAMVYSKKYLTIPTWYLLCFYSWVGIQLNFRYKYYYKLKNVIIDLWFNKIWISTF